MQEPDVVYPSAQFLIETHQILIERFGGVHGIRDEDGVHAALARAEQVRAYSDGTPHVIQLACAIAYSIVRIRHPFVDGNKRVALAALIVTLELNGVVLDARENETAETIEAVAQGHMSEEDFVGWVRTNISSA